MGMFNKDKSNGGTMEDSEANPYATTESKDEATL